MLTAQPWLRYRLIGLVVCVLVTGFTITNLISYRDAVSTLKATILHSELPLTGSNIYSEVQADLIRPVFISSQMANDTFVQDWLESGEKNVGQITRYLEAIRQKYGVFTSFLISDRTRSYYHFHGDLRRVDPKSPDDVWYFRARAMQAPYEINIDYDQASNRTLTIFVNYRVLDTDGNFLGITGVGLTLDSVRRIVDRYSTDFQRNVYFINKAGTVMVGSTRAPAAGQDIRSLGGLAPLAGRILSAQEGQFEYRRNGAAWLLDTRFIPELGWYVAVEQNQADATRGLWQSFMVNLWIGFGIILVTAAIVAYAVSVFHRRLDTMATTDKLTGLANRQMFDDTLARLLHARRRTHPAFAVLLLDIDRFKRINDTLGHLRGDAVIRMVAATAQAQLRQTDMVCRWGGEELIALVPHCSLDDACSLGEVLREAIANATIFAPDDGTRVTVSIGVTTCRPDDSSDTLLSRADRALYRAKRDGRNCVRTAEQSAATIRTDAEPVA
jgi:diguanylate cyclase (GGDEF)-like protein